MMQGMLADSQPLNILEHFAFSPGGHPMCLYGDPAYPLRTHLQAPFTDARLTPDMQLFNKSMNRVRYGHLDISLGRLNFLISKII